MNIPSAIQYLLETGTPHPITIDTGLTLSYHPADNMIAAGRPDAHPTPAEVINLIQAIAAHIPGRAIATGLRLGRSSHTLTKTNNAQHHQPAQHIIEFMWTTPKKEQPQ